MSNIEKLQNIEKLNKYQDIYASVGSGGTLYLDSNTSSFYNFSETVIEPFKPIFEFEFALQINDFILNLIS